MKQRLLWYFADPMCSWCWGFAPTFERIQETYQGRIEMGLMLGGLRPGAGDALEARAREEILHHWQAVHETTGQPFRFEGALPEGFVYDTEPPSRAVVAVSAIRPQAAIPYFRALQAAFYAEGRDITRESVLSELVSAVDVDAQQFRETFAAPATREHTKAHFIQAAQLGVQGFPTVLLQNDDGLSALTAGYQPFEALQPLLDAWLQQ